MKRVIALALLGSAAVLVVAVNTSAGNSKGHHRAGHTIAVVEHATTDAVSNGDPNADVAGNILTFANDVYDAADTHKVGSDQGSCVRTVVGAVLGMRLDHVPTVRADHGRGSVLRHG